MDEIAKALAELAKQLGVTVEYLWPLLVQREEVIGWLQLGAVVPLAALIGVPALWAWRNLDAAESRLMVGVPASTLLLIPMCLFFSGLQHVLAPGGAATIALLSLITRGP